MNVLIELNIMSPAFKWIPDPKVEIIDVSTTLIHPPEQFARGAPTNVTVIIYSIKLYGATSLFYISQNYETQGKNNRKKLRDRNYSIAVIIKVRTGTIRIEYYNNI